jgi:hypothetical protein
MIVDHWRYRTHLGLLQLFLEGQSGTLRRGTAQTSAAVLGPWAYNVGVMSLVSFSFIPASLLSP